MNWSEKLQSNIHDVQVLPFWINKELPTNVFKSFPCSSIQYTEVNCLFNSNTFLLFLLLLPELHELLLWFGVYWQRSSTSLNVWGSWASWTSHLIYLSTQTRRRWHASFLVLKGMRRWVGDRYPCDRILRWVLHTNVCSWPQAGHTAKPEMAHSSAVVSPYICARKRDFNCRAEARFEEQRAHTNILEKKKGEWNSILS